MEPMTVESEKANGALTALELEILWFLGQGDTALEIEQRLGVSARTSRGHIEQIWNKLGLNSRRDRARIAVRPDPLNPLISPAAPEAAWVRFWLSPGFALVVASILMLVVSLTNSHQS